MSERRIRGHRIRPQVPFPIVETREVEQNLRVVCLITDSGEITYDVLVRERPGCKWWGILWMTLADERRIPKYVMRIGMRMVRRHRKLAERRAVR
jgi:hypothetical protein